MASSSLVSIEGGVVDRMLETPASKIASSNDSVVARTNNTCTIIVNAPSIKEVVLARSVSVYRHLESAAIRYPTSFQAIAYGVQVVGTLLGLSSAATSTPDYIYSVGYALPIWFIGSALLLGVGPHYYSFSQYNDTQQREIDSLNREFQSDEYPDFKDTLLTLVSDDDWNGAFQHRRHFYQWRQLRKSMHVSCCLVHRERDIDEAISNLKCQGKNIIALEISTHGTGKCYLVGKQVHELIKKMLQEGIQLKRVLLYSCSTGIPGGEAELISKLPGAEDIEVYAPLIPSDKKLRYIDAQNLPAIFYASQADSPPKLIMSIYQSGQIITDKKIHKDADTIIQGARKDCYVDQLIISTKNFSAEFKEYENAIRKPHFGELLNKTGLEKISCYEFYCLLFQCVQNACFQALQQLLLRKDAPFLSSGYLKILLKDALRKDSAASSILLLGWPFSSLHDEEEIVQLIGEAKNKELISYYFQRHEGWQNICQIGDYYFTSAFLTIRILAVFLAILSIYCMSQFT